MRIIYESYDGSQFNSEEECLTYENSLKHSDLFSIVFFDRLDRPYTIRKDNMYDDEVYYRSEKIEIHNKKELNDLLWLSEECGWCEFEQITSIGSWIRLQSNISQEGIWKRSS